MPGQDTFCVTPGFEVEGNKTKTSHISNVAVNDDIVKLPQRPQVTKRIFTLTWDEYENVKPSSDNSVTLSSAWTQLMYRHFHQLYPSCPLVFKGNRLRQKISRKKNARFWIGRGKCKATNCIKVIFEIKDTPIVHKAVTVDVTITGCCSHANRKEEVYKRTEEDNNSDSDSSAFNRPNKALLKRHLRGSERRIAAEHLTQSKEEPMSSFYAALGEMNENELRAGNITACQSPQVLQQAKYEYGLGQRLAEDMLQELRIQYKAWEAAFPDNEVQGYIQCFGEKPFFATFYLRDQVEMYIRNASSKDIPMIVHYDATGSVMRKVENQKQPYYYALIEENSDIPFLEFLSTSHTSRWLAGLLSTFLKDVKTCAPNKQLRPRVVVTDFSYAMIYSAILSFNDSTILPYLMDTYSVLCDRERKISGNSFTAVVICEAHMMKTISMRLNRCERNNNRRKATLVIFARLQRCRNLQVMDNTESIGLNLLLGNAYSTFGIFKGVVALVCVY